MKYFFPSEFGTDVEYDETSAHEIPHQRKLRVRALLREISSTSTSITGNNDDDGYKNHLEYTYIVTGPYADADRSLYLSAQPPEKEIWGTFDVHRKRAVLLGDGNGKISLTTMRDVGKFVVAALLQQQKQQQQQQHGGNDNVDGGDGVTKNRALRVNSFTTTPHELLSEFERQTGGGEKWQVGYTSVEELERLERENPVVTLRRIWTSGKTLYAKRDNDELLNGAKEEDDGFFCLDNVESAVAQAIDVQRKLIAAGILYN